MSKLETKYNTLMWILRLNKLSKNPERDILFGNVKIDGKTIKTTSYRLDAKKAGTRIVSVKQPSGFIKQRII